MAKAMTKQCAAEVVIRELARAHGVDARRHALDGLASDINRLTNERNYEPDDVMRILRNLRRQNVIGGREATLLLASYLKAME